MQIWEIQRAIAHRDARGTNPATVVSQVSFGIIYEFRNNYGNFGPIFGIETRKPGIEIRKLLGQF